MKTFLDDALHARGYDTLTPVQEAVLDPDLEGRDLLVSAQTGSGKTVAFGLAVAPALLGDADRFAPAERPLGLVIAPTRELALQVRRELSWLYAGAGVAIASAVGGTDQRDERRALARGAHIVVATPGRLRDHLTRGAVDLGGLRAVVLDEADEMLDLGFREDLEFILAAAPAERRTLMFSATVPRAIADLARTFQSDALRVAVDAGAAPHADIAYRALEVGAGGTEAAVVNVALEAGARTTIVFANTRAAVASLTAKLTERGFRAVSLSGELSQAERTNALAAMRDGRAEICVATDVAARGIDLPGLDLVIHAELPSSHETLLHRSGRTGRAGRKGLSVMVVTPKVRRKAERLLREARLQADWGTPPDRAAVEACQRDALARIVAEAPAGDAEAVDALLAQATPRQLAVALLSLHGASVPRAEEIAAPARAAPREDRPPFGPEAWVSLSGGRAAGAEPRRILAMLTAGAGLDRREVGAIRIRPDQSLVQLTPAAADTLSRAAAEGALAGGVRLTLLDAAPQDALGPRKGAGKPADRRAKPHRKDRPPAGARPRRKAFGRTGS